METWTSSASCCHAGARRAMCPVALSAIDVPARSSGSARRSASAAGARAPGRSAAAPSVPGVAWHSSGRAARSSTTDGRGRSSPPGRNAAAAISPACSRSSSWRWSLRPSVEALTFVPGDRERGRERGHVPAAGLARELGASWGMPVEGLLERRPGSRRQTGLQRSERRANVRGAFACAGRAPASVAVVDDVYTTGATVSACATALRRAGARRVEVVCLARAVR